MSKLVTAVAIVCTFLAAPAQAQVGHAPERSPYRPIPARTGLVLHTGLLGSSGGRLGLGPTGGLLVGTRLETSLSGPSDGFLGFTLGRPERLIIDPNGAAATRVSGPVEQSLVVIDAGLSILLAGEKTWRGLAPYLGGAIGMAFARTPAADTVSTFRFSTKLVTGPHLGFRYYVAPTVSFRVEGRLLFWQLKYPSPFFLAPADAPTDPPVLDPNADSDSEWVTNPVLMLGLGIAFRL